MKTKSLYILITFAVVICGCRKQQSIIEGTVENPVFESSKVYLLALDATVTRNIDSTTIKDGKFRFAVPADSLAVKILRIPSSFPEVVEDFILVTEQGTLNVQMSASSKGSGTRLNDMLMNWKSEKREYDSLQFDIYMRSGSPGTDPALSDILLRNSRELAGKHLTNVINTLNQNIHNGIGLLFFKVYYNDLPAETKKKVLELTGDEYLKKDLQLWSMVTMDQKLAE